jgi:hypothetical protein
MSDCCELSDRIVTLASLLAAASTASSWFAVGCCHASRHADDVRAELVEQNRKRAEPSARSAAMSVGATLLPVLPQRAARVEPCASAFLPGVAPDPNCMAWVSDDGRAFRRIDEQGSTSLFVRIDSPYWRYARLALRGNTLVVVLPVVAPGVTRHRRECPCRVVDSAFMSGFHPYSGWEPVFVLEDLPLERVETVHAPIVVDAIVWRCRGVMR